MTSTSEEAATRAATRNRFRSREGFNGQRQVSAGRRYSYHVHRIEMNPEGTEVERDAVIHTAPTNEDATRYAFHLNLRERTDAIYVTERVENV